MCQTDCCLWLQAVSHLHSRGRGHCDIKATNVMVHFDADFAVDKVTLIDLGFSNTHAGVMTGPAIADLCIQVL